MGRHISAELKESILKKVLVRGEKTLTTIAKEYGVGVSTLSKWTQSIQQGKSDKILDRAVRFKHLKAIAQLNETDIGAYCRQHGLYSMQLKEWENDFMKQDAPDHKSKAEIIALRKKNTDLERELRRKEKALAEVAALLVLKKKADAIWGADEDE